MQVVASICSGMLPPPSPAPAATLLFAHFMFRLYIFCFSFRQDAWRRCQTPGSINLAELGEEEWEVIRDTEDEQARAPSVRPIVIDPFSQFRTFPVFSARLCHLLPNDCMLRDACVRPDLPRRGHWRTFHPLSSSRGYQTASRRDASAFYFPKTHHPHTVSTSNLTSTAPSPPVPSPPLRLTRFVSLGSTGRGISASSTPRRTT